MVKIFENTCTLAYPWDIATLAFFRKYPDPRVGHVKEVDTFHRSLNAETGELTTYRLIACETKLPGWVAALAGGTTRAYTLEQTVANPHTKTMTVRSRNVTGASVVMIDETCVYTQDELNPTCTKYRQVAHIKGNLYGARSALEQFAHSDMIAKSATGIKVVEDICHRLSTHGVQGLFEHLTNRPKMAFALAGAEPAPSAQ